MKNLATMLVLAAFVCSITGLVLAQDAPKKDTPTTADAPKAKPTPGTVVKVDGKIVVIKIKWKESGKPMERDRKITTDDKTVITLNGKEAKLTDLEAGMPVTYTRAPGSDNSVALTIAATAAPTSAPATAPAK